MTDVQPHPPLRIVPAPDPYPDPEPRERFEHVLDDPDDLDDPQPVHPAGGFGLPPTAPDRAPVIPAPLRSRKAFLAATGRRGDAIRYEAQFQALRLPWTLLKTLFWALWGTLVLLHRLKNWWWLTEATGARLQAAVDNDGKEYRIHHVHQRKVRGERGTVIAVCALVVAVASILVTVLFPLAWAVILPVLAVFAARAGRPDGRPIITSSMTEPVVRVISQDALVLAYAAGGLCKPGVEGQELRLGVMARERGGTRVKVFLPHGGTFAAVVAAKPKIASGLDVKVSQIYFTEDDTSERRHDIWIADEDPLAIPAGRTPLLRLRPVNVWRDLFEMGVDHYGRKVRFSLLWISFLIGAQPRKGKTFTARLIALFCALDPYVRITIADGKAAPDWRSFRLVAHRMIFGTRMGRDGDPVEKLRDELRAIERHIEDTNNFLSELPTTECPEGKLTEALCRKYPKRLFLWLLVLEEVYFYVETDDQAVNKDIVQRLSNIRSAGPSAGVIVLTSLQKPAGVGAGDVQRLWNRFRDNHEARIALKCGNRVVSEAVLGGDAYSEGWDASALPDGKRYRGVGIVYQVPDLEETLTVRSYLADGEDAEKILIAARKLREQAGTLTGEAADEDLSAEPRDVLADVLSVFRGEPGLWWTELADRLAESIPERWADVSVAALTAQCRDLGVPSIAVTIARQTSKGCRREHLERAMRGDSVVAQ